MVTMLAAPVSGFVPTQLLSRAIICDSMIVGGRVYQQLGLRGARRIVFEDMCRLLSTGDNVSVSRLAAVTGYDHSTVHRVLKSLRRDGIVEMTHRANGASAQYRIAEEHTNMMIDFRGLMSALFNVLTASSEERARRMMMAWIAKRIYDRGKLLKQMAAQSGNELAASINIFLESNNVLDVYQVWELETANHLLGEINDYIEMIDLAAQ